MGEMQGRDQQVYLAKLAEQVCFRFSFFFPFPSAMFVLPLYGIVLNVTMRHFLPSGETRLG
jgi:hypothetical protein